MDEQLRIAGLTGVELKLDIAGAGSRSYAFVIDWHIRLLLALAWFFVWFVLLPSVGLALPSIHSFANALRSIAVLPAILIYFFYHPVLELLMRGRTPGKRMAGVRIVTRNGGTPSAGSLIIRNLFRLIDSLPTLYLIGLVTCLLTEQRVRIGDLAAGTLLVLDDPTSTRSLGQLGTLVAQSGLPPSAVELIDDLLRRWTLLDTAKRAALARTILARIDPGMAPETLSTAGDAELAQRLRAALAGLRSNA
jgi:uncharacterized RDD family membrane protein YckC